MSDNPHTCRAVLQLFEGATDPFNDQIIQLARARGNQEIIEMLTGRKENRERKKLLVKTAVRNTTAHILDLVPSFVEFEYHSKTELLAPLLKNSTDFVPFATLLDKLHVKEVHYAGCPNDCHQKEGCQRIRQASVLVKNLARRLETRSPFYRGMSTKMVGSLSEGARVFHMDELDVHFWFDQKKGEGITFEPSTQRAKTKSSMYRKDNNDLDTEKVFFDFLRNIYEILPTLEVSPGMKVLSTDFIPCLRCMSTTNSTPETVRCRHRPGCKTHDDSCDCREFTSPSLSHTRSGAVLHLEWVEENGARFNLDVDLVPILPTSTPYNGDITSVANTLATERVVGWLDELGKIGGENMADAVHLPHLKGQQKWHLNLRLLNRNTVMARQVIL